MEKVRNDLWKLEKGQERLQNILTGGSDKNTDEDIDKDTDKDTDEDEYKRIGSNKTRIYAGANLRPWKYSSSV